MKRTIPMKLLSLLIVMVMTVSIFTISASAAEDNSEKYLKDVFIAYGETKEEAEKWLRDNGWEPFADLNEGKSSQATGIHNAVAVMGIKRTSDPTEAITDMATMNMKGGYSFDDYESLVKQKKTDIDEFINTFVPALQEYRDNYNGKGSEGGKKRAQMAHDIINKFFDGDPNGDYAVNDTGKPLGDLLLNKTKTEIGDDAYNKLSAEQKLNTADLQQIILESSGPAVLIIEQTLALATDTAETSWLDRLNGLSGEGLVEHIAEYAPEAKGQDLAPSAAMSLLASHFEDYAKKLAAEWNDVHEDIVWYESYCDDNNLWQEDDESDEAYKAKVEKYFNELQENDEERYLSELNRFNLVSIYYYVLPEIEYSGEWGGTLYDFFRPEDENAYYGDDYKKFAPLAAALSDGQRASLEFVTLSTLLRLSLNSDSVMEADLPSTDKVFTNSKDEKLEKISIYSGINRAIFRKGVVLTSNARMQKSMGKDPYDQLWDEGGMADIIFYATLGTGTVSMVAGAAMVAYSANNISGATTAATVAENKLNTFVRDMQNIMNDEPFEKLRSSYENGVTQAKAEVSKVGKIGTAGRWLMGIGGALMILAAALKGVQIYQYYHRTFTAIPIMIVDEADIVTETIDENGEKVKNINFDQFAYYEVVKCNRQEIGIHTNAQKGVSDYESWGCGDAADINADVGKQWLAMYVNRSSAKGTPILADTLKLQKGSEKTPDDCNGCLHMFTFENAAKLDDTAYCYRDDNKGMYLFWKGDETAFAKSTSTGADTAAASGEPASTASAFNAGYLALAGIGGLVIGILGATAVMFPMLKKKREEEIAE